MADKLDMVYKKIVNRQYTSAVKNWYEENPGVPFKLKGSDVWVDNIPVTPPGADTAVVIGYRSGNRLALEKDISVNNEKCWRAMNGPVQMGGFITPRYGQDYTVRVFDGANNEIPTTHSCGWFFDYEAGVLTFDNDPGSTGLNDSGFTVEVYKYAGTTCDDIAGALSGSAWQDPVSNIVDEPVGGETEKTRYLVSNTPTGDFAGHANNLAEFDGVNWQFTEQKAGFITYVITYDRLYVYDNNNGWAWSGIDSADLDYDHSDSTLNALSVKAALDELDALLNARTSTIYVDNKRTDSYSEAGTENKPYRALATALSGILPSDALVLASGTYNGDGQTIPSGVSVRGEGGQVKISGAISFGVDSTSLLRASVSNIEFTDGGVATFNSVNTINNVKATGQVIINNDLHANQFDVISNGSGDALVVNSGEFRWESGKGNLAADASSLRHVGGSIRLGSVQITGSSATIPTVSSTGGVFRAADCVVLNTGGGKAIVMNNGALIGDPNELMDVTHAGGIDTGSAQTIVEGVVGGNPTSSLPGNANLHFRGGTQLKNESAIIKTEAGGDLIGLTINDSVDRVANVTKYDSDLGELIIEPCVDDISEPVEQ